MDLSRRNALIALSLVVVYFIWQTRDAFGVYFMPDDLMNLYQYVETKWPALLRANVFFWSSSYRPLGGLLYKGIHAIWGFRPLPFHLVLHAVLIANIVMTYALASVLTSSRLAGVGAAFLIAWHARFLDLYYSFGTIYDSLSFLCIVIVLFLYIRAREADRQPTTGECIGMLIAFVCALNTKEVAVTVPVFLGLYELIVKPSIREWKITAAGGLMSAIYFAGKYLGRQQSVFANNPAYDMTFTWARWSENFLRYLRQWTMNQTLELTSIVIAAGLLLLAARNRRAIWALLLMLVGFLPVIFIPGRSAFVTYLPAFGLVLLLATLPKPLILAVAVIAAYVNWTDPLHAKAFMLQAAATNRSTAEQLHALQPVLRQNARLYFLNDPYEPPYYDLFFDIRLSYDNFTIAVDRKKAGQAMTGSYDAIFDFDEASGRWTLAGTPDTHRTSP